MTTIQIDEMIDLISDTVPDFLDIAKENDREMFGYINYLVIFSKILAQRQVLCFADIQGFTNEFFNKTADLMEVSRNITMANLCYDYIKDYYEDFMNYLETVEEYEMCENYKNFFIEFNDKTKRINDGLET